jgi:hypothetical protein
MAVLARLPTLLDRRIGFRFLDRTGAWDGDLPAPFSQGTDWERYGGDYGMATVQDGPNAGSRSIECWIRGDNVDSGIGGYPNNRCEMPIDLDVSAGSVRYIGMDIWINAANQGYWQSCTQLKDGSYEGQGIGVGPCDTSWASIGALGPLRCVSGTPTSSGQLLLRKRVSRWEAGLLPWVSHLNQHGLPLEGSARTLLDVPPSRWDVLRCHHLSQEMDTSSTATE